MDEDRFNMETCKFLKVVGVTSQREIELAVRQAVAAGTLKGDEKLSASIVLSIPSIGLSHRIDGTIDFG